MYNRILTKMERTKEALAKKLDSIKSDVTNVNNSVTNLPSTLDTKFSALTTKVDGVKTDVASVGGKVDTAQAAISNKVDAVGANVTAIDKTIAKSARLKVVQVTVEPMSSPEMVLNVQGCGQLCYVSVPSFSDGCNLVLNVDGKMMTFNGKPSCYGGLMVCSLAQAFFHQGNYIFGNYNTDARGYMIASNNFGFGAGGNRITNMDLFTRPQEVIDVKGESGSQQIVLLQKEPILFDRNLTVSLKITGSARPIYVIYSLDQ